MKKALLLFMSTLFILFPLNNSTVSYANTADISNQVIVSQSTEHLEDGSYIIITVSKTVFDAQPTSSTYTQTGSKYYVAYSSDHTEQWCFTVHGTFSVDSGVSATCTNSSYSIDIYEDAWKNKSAETYCSGNQAIGDATFVKKLLFITTETENCHVTLTCDPLGNLS